MSASNVTNIQTSIDFLKTVSKGITKSSAVQKQELLLKTSRNKILFCLASTIVTIALAVLFGIILSPLSIIPLGMLLIFPIKKWDNFSEQYRIAENEFSKAVKKDEDNFKNATKYINQKREEKERYLNFHFNSREGSRDYKSPSQKLNEFEKIYDNQNKDLKELIIKIDNLKMDLSWLPNPTQKNFISACKRYLKPKDNEDNYIDISGQISKAHGVYESFNYVD